MKLLNLDRKFQACKLSCRR